MKHYFCSQPHIFILNVVLLNYCRNYYLLLTQKRNKNINFHYYDQSIGMDKLLLVIKLIIIITNIYIIKLKQ